ncbi:AAA family ATPase [Alteromonas ponticola]|uniref:AAA family ATPase n=1 Tax=Alteromonas aquimaris TaxID=2998417 RepID=A0ABT3P342_9ALTE|nr:AAA family ATPase [Alteromonas aquimaris]MCW8107178.1 AAA family ATPase [Alteromonas aquimaris]
MNNILIFGNSGAGKSTLAKKLAEQNKLAHFELDSIAWLPGAPPVRRPLKESMRMLNHFTDSYENWVIEGCYTDLLTHIAPRCDEMIFLNLPVNQCIANARNRPWEPHKYSSPAEQDANLLMLIAWIKEYETRTDTFSLQSHLLLYKNFTGNKKMITRHV